MWYLPIIFISYRELALIFKKKNLNFDFLIFLIFLLLPFFVMLWTMVFKSKLGPQRYFLNYFYALIICLIMTGCYANWIFKHEYHGYKRQEFFVFFKLLINFYLFWNAVFFISILNGAYIFLTLLLLCYLNDSIAYVFGQQFGKIKCFKHSPNKTLEGCIAGILASIFQMTFMFYLFGSFSIFSVSIKYTYAWFLTLVLSIVANAGDYYYSKQKRFLQIKDYGTVLGKHGGFWDRFDSHTFVFIICLIVSWCVGMLSHNN